MVEFPLLTKKPYKDFIKDKENFLKYNQLCKHPFQQEDLEKLKELLESEDKEELVKAMRNILNALQ